MTSTTTRTATTLFALVATAAWAGCPGGDLSSPAGSGGNGDATSATASSSNGSASPSSTSASSSSSVSSGEGASTSGAGGSGGEGTTTGPGGQGGAGGASTGSGGNGTSTGSGGAGGPSGTGGSGGDGSSASATTGATTATSTGTGEPECGELGQECCAGDLCAAGDQLACSGGFCGCDLGFEDCDVEPNNGCEAGLLADPDNCSTCDHSCAGGACVVGFCQPGVLVPEGTSDGEVSAGGWAPAGYGTGYVDFMPYDAAGFVGPSTNQGTGLVQLRAFDPEGLPGAFLTTEAQSIPIGIGPWITSSGVFWTEGTDLRRVARGGGAVSTVATGLLGAQVFHVEGDNLYFAVNESVRKIESGSLTVTTVYPGPSASVFFGVSGTALYTMSGRHLLVGDTSGAVLQTAYANFIPVGAGTPGVRVDPVAVYVYGGSSEGYIFRYDRSTGLRTEIVVGNATVRAVTYLVVDGDTLYFVDNAAAPYRLYRVPSAGGAPVEVIARSGAANDPPLYGLSQLGPHLFTFDAGYARIAK